MKNIYILVLSQYILVVKTIERKLTSAYLALQLGYSYQTTFF